MLTSVRKIELPVRCVSGSREVSSVIRFLAAEVIPTPVIHTRIKNIYGDSVMPLRTVRSCVQKFKEEKREDVHDAVLGFQGRPVRTLCRRKEEGTDEFNDVCGHSRHTEEEYQAKMSGIITSRSHFTATKQRHTCYEWLRRKLRTSCGKFSCIRQIHPISHLRTTSSQLWRNFWVRNSSQKMGAEDEYLSMDERCGHAVLRRWY